MTYNLSFDKSNLGNFKSSITKAVNKAKQFGRQEQAVIREATNEFTTDTAHRMGREISRRWNAKDAPPYDPFTGQAFPSGRQAFNDRTGALAASRVGFRVGRQRRTTFRKGLSLSLTIIPPNVSIGSERPRGLPPDDSLQKVGDSSIPTLATFGDLFEMIEYGIGRMRFSSQSYTTFSGQSVGQIQGFYMLDRIVKDVYVRTAPEYARGLSSVISKAVRGR